MTALVQQIEELGVQEWAALTKRCAEAAVAAAARQGIAPSGAVAAVAAMSEEELIEHRNRFGPAPKRLSPVAQLVHADQLRVVAERQAQKADQDRRDAEAAAEMARAEAERSSRAATAARELARATKTESARQEAQRAEERAAAQQRLDLLRDELEQVRADAAAEAAAAREALRAAEARAEERAAERSAERAAAEQTIQELRAELARVRADAEAEVAAAQEKVRAAEERAEQRIAERASERQAAEHRVEQVRGELERVRADAEAAVAAARGQASGEIAAAQQTAQVQIAQARSAAQEAIARAHTEVEEVRAEASAHVAEARRQADAAIATAHEAVHAEIARVHAEREEIRRAAGLKDPGAGDTLLSIPVPAAGIRAYTGAIEDALSTVRDVDYVLEAAVSGRGRPEEGTDAELVRRLVGAAAEQAWHLSEELRTLPTRFSTAWDVQAAENYVAVAANAYGALLQRIEAAVEQLRVSGESELVQIVTAMLDEHPWRRT
ncbi:hypothetical protein HMPREF0591_1672 [Mycobacterium parascrofulaceum ATCC BAA-614]|uniref:Uncharacterized protein n=1 Tax=Mycobacterium parascrofulaceum ATCC BAA-614 TaxID=525368 RepID=D5P670_9MYCO|nr:hypothetical protein [Mycobacterium parascrofulaceum]EFG78429.1 hypothetical protein HMPREF0591_1672 [Mycobacterium parascrofulaceum ATCC BAA-614]